MPTFLLTSPCPTCGGSGFAGWGTGYDAVCECGGARCYPEYGPFEELLAGDHYDGVVWHSYPEHPVAATLNAVLAIVAVALNMPRWHPYGHDVRDRLHGFQPDDFVALYRARLAEMLDTTS